MNLVQLLRVLHWRHYLTRKLCTEDEQVFIENGKYRFNKVNISDSHRGPAYLTVRGVLEQSSNVGMSKARAENR